MTEPTMPESEGEAFARGVEYGRAEVNDLVLKLQKIQVRTGALEMAAQHHEQNTEAGGLTAAAAVLETAERFLEFMTGAEEL